MRTVVGVAIAIALTSASLVAQDQEKKPVPKDSMRVFVSGCTKGYIFTAGPRNPDQPGGADIPEGTHFRMNGPKKMMADIKAHEGSMVELTGLVKKGQPRPDGVAVGGGVRISPGPGSIGGSVGPNPVGGQAYIDVESWRPVEGSCPSK